MLQAGDTVNVQILFWLFAFAFDFISLYCTTFVEYLSTMIAISFIWHFLALCLNICQYYLLNKK